MKRLVFLFVQFFKISLFIIGGGIAMLPVIEDVFVKKNELLTDEDFSQMVALTQTVPGLIAINAAIFVGFKLRGIWGSVFALLGVIIPSLFIIILIAAFFPLLDIQNKVVLTAFDFVRAAVAGIFLAMFFRFYKNTVKDFFAFFIVVVIGFLFLLSKNIVVTIFLSLIFGVIYRYIQDKANEPKKKEIKNG